MDSSFDWRDAAGMVARFSNQLRLEPDDGLESAMQTIEQQRTARRARNLTVEYLKGLNTPMGDKLAAMVSTGQLKGSDAYKYMFDMEQEERAQQRAMQLATFQNKLAMKRDAAKPVKPTNAQVLHNMAIAAGHPEGSDMYNQIVFKLPAEKQLSPEIQMRMDLAKQRNLEAGSPEFMNFVFGDEIPLFMPSGMEVDIYSKFDDQTKQAITASAASGVLFPKDGTQADQQSYLESVMKVRDEISKEGTILKPSDALYQEYVRNAFGKEFDMNQGIGGVIIKKKDNTAEFVPFSGGGVEVDVKVNTGSDGFQLTEAEEKQIEEMAKDEMVPEYLDPNDPSKGYKRDDKNQIVYRPASGSKLEYDRNKAELDEIKRNFSDKITDEMKVDNITFSANRILDIVVGKPDKKTGLRASGKDAKYNKSTVARLLTLDPPEAGVRGQAFGNLGIFSSDESRTVKNFIENIVANIGFDRLQLMREASASGAGLGQVSNLELGQLNNSMRALQQDLLPKDLAFNVQKVVEIYSKILNDPIARAVKEATTKEEALRLIQVYQDVQAGFTEGKDIFSGGDGSYTIKLKD